MLRLASPRLLPKGCAAWKHTKVAFPSPPYEWVGGKVSPIVPSIEESVAESGRVMAASMGDAMVSVQRRAGAGACLTVACSRRPSLRTTGGAALAKSTCCLPHSCAAVATPWRG